MAMPYQFMQNIIDHAPTVARPLKLATRGKRAKYLELCNVLLRKFPTESMGRSVAFLLDLVSNTNPGQLAPIPFYTTPGQQDLIDISRQTTLGRVVPTITFQARINRNRR